jgi:cell division septum initiation protein DivIVA
MITDDELIPNRYAAPEVEDLLQRAVEVVAQARPSPMSSTVRVDRDELLDLLEQALERLPAELRAARWLLKEHEELLEQGRQERDEIIAAGAAQVERMIQRQEITKAAEARARQIVGDARAEARTLRRQTEDFCDQRLASFELALQRTLLTVREGREKLMGVADLSELDAEPRAADGEGVPAAAPPGVDDDWEPFDQDQG